MNEILIEIEATQNGETKFFDDVYANELEGQMGDILQRFVRDSRNADRLVVYLSKEEPLKIWEREINDYDKAVKLLTILREITTITKKELNEN